MAIPKVWIFSVLAFLLIWYIVFPFFGIYGATLSLLILAIGILMTIKSVANKNVFPWRFSKLIALAVLGIGLYMTGVAGTLMATVVPSGTTFIDTTQMPTSCSVSEELKGKSVNIYFTAYDFESNTPYSSAVEIGGSSCWLFVNGEYKKTNIGTSGNTTSGGIVVGDVISLYCGGTSYYTENIENLCVDQQELPVEVRTHSIEAESDMTLTMYDDSGATALSTGTTSEEDYYVTQGAGGEDSVYAKLKVNSANAEYDHCAWGTIAMTNLTDFRPVSGYKQDITPNWAEDVSVAVDEYGSGTTSVTDTYTIYKADAPTKLHQWESLKVEFVLEADDTNDPIQTGDNNTLPAKYVLLSIDCQNAKGDPAGGLTYDIHDHSISQADVGLAETETSPLGGEIGVIIEAR